MSLNTRLVSLAQAIAADVKTLTTKVATLQSQVPGKITVSTTAPATPAVGDLWVDLSS